MKMIIIGIMVGVLVLFSTPMAFAHPPEQNFIPKQDVWNSPDITGVPDVITWDILIPPGPGPQNELRVIYAIERAFEIWEEYNPELNFERDQEGIPDILVQWELEPTYFGGSYAGVVVDVGDYNGKIYLVLGYFCEGIYVERSTNSLINTMMHEIGHIIGLAHSSDKKHLMYGYNDEEFDEKGFNIPKELVGWDSPNRINILERYFTLYEQLVDQPNHWKKNTKIKMIENVMECHGVIKPYNYMFNSLNITKPSAPTNLTAIPDEGQITLTWNPPEDDGGSPIIAYEIVLIRTDYAPLLIAKVTTTEYTHLNLTNDKEYEYAVDARNAVGYGPLSEKVSATPTNIVNPPTNLTANTVDGDVVLSWNAPKGIVTDYKIEYYDQKWIPIEDGVSIETTYTVSNTETPHKYEYRVSAVNEKGTSQPSNVVKIDIEMSKGFTATREGDGVRLNWDSQENVVRYVAEINEGTGWFVVYSGNNTSTFVGSVSKAEFRVYAINEIGNSDAITITFP